MLSVPSRGGTPDGLGGPSLARFPLDPRDAWCVSRHERRGPGGAQGYDPPLRDLTSQGCTTSRVCGRGVNVGRGSGPRPKPTAQGSRRARRGTRSARGGQRPSYSARRRPPLGL